MAGRTALATGRYGARRRNTLRQLHREARAYTEMSGGLPTRMARSYPRFNPFPKIT